jgi:hypothetical protein
MSGASADEVEAVALDLVDQMVVKAICSVPQRLAVAKAIMRAAGSALATLASHDDAFLEHTKLARRHHGKMTHRGAQR